MLLYADFPSGAMLALIGTNGRTGCSCTLSLVFLDKSMLVSARNHERADVVVMPTILTVFDPIISTSLHVVRILELAYLPFCTFSIPYPGARAIYCSQCFTFTFVAPHTTTVRSYFLSQTISYESGCLIDTVGPSSPAF